MAMVAKLTVSKATQVDPANWVTTLDVYGPQLIPTEAPGGSASSRRSRPPTAARPSGTRSCGRGASPSPGGRTSASSAGRRPGRRPLRR